jgi:hypothetical protein
MSNVAEQVAALELPCIFSTVGIGEGTCRIGIAIDRSRLTVAQADKKLCGRRLTGRIISGSNGDAPGQKTMVEDTEISGTFDVKSISMNRKKYSCALTLSLDGLDFSLLEYFAKRSGRLVIEEVADLPTDGDKDEEDGGDEE